MARVYFDSTLFLSILANEPTANSVRQLLTELGNSRTGIYTSILTIAECCVGSLRANGDPNKPLELIYDIAKVQSITEDIAISTARIEAKMILLCPPGEKEPTKRRRRRWDCFHMATALDLKCTALYSFDEDYGKMAEQCGLPILCSYPESKNRTLFN